VNLFQIQKNLAQALLFRKTANTLSVNVVVTNALIDEQRKGKVFIDIFWAKATGILGPALLVLLLAVISCF